MNKNIRKNMFITMFLFSIIWLTISFSRINNVYIEFSTLSRDDFIKKIIIRHFSIYLIISTLIIFMFIKLAKYYKILSDKKELINRENRLFLNSPIVLFQWPLNKNLPIRYVSNNVFKVLGYKKEDFLNGKVKYVDIVYKDDLGRVFKEAGDYSDNLDISEFEQKYRILKADKTLINIHDKTYIVRDNTGKALYYEGYIIDMTKQINMEKEIFNKTNNLKNFEIIAGLGYWEFDIVKNELYWSDGVYDIFEIKPSEFEGSYEYFLSKVHPDDRELVNKKYNDSFKNNLDYHIEHRIVVKDQIKHILDYSKTYFDENSKPIRSLGVIFDITKEKKLEKELLKVKNLESLGIVAGSLAHNLNNLIFIIQGNLDLIVTDKHDYVNNINDSVEKIRDLTQKMLVFAEGGEPIKKVHHHFSEYISDFVRNFVIKENIKIEFNLPKSDFYINIDENMIKDVIINILENSIDAFIVNKVQDKIIHFEISLVDDFECYKNTNYSQYIKIMINDNAGGIKKEHKENVVLPYFTTKNSNLGLGLTMADTVIKRHNGIMNIDTEEFFGTKVTIYLPRIDNEVVSKKIKKTASNIMGGLVSINHNRILIMDDEELILKMSKKILERNGYEVELALHGNEAIAKYKDSYNNKKAFKAVILDLSIPNGMGGQETAQELLKIDKNCKLIVSSGYSNSDVLSNYKNYGFIGRLPKPYKFNDLLEVLKNI